jgi:type IV pilus assembly protein PilV
MKRRINQNVFLRTMRTRQAGSSLIEILITMLIMAFGLLGLAGFVTKSTALTADTTQRARATALVSDMASRLASNKTNAASYVVAPTNPYGTAVISCASMTGATLDLCQWNNLLTGSNDAQAGGNASALGYRGCITKPISTDSNYVVTVAWGSVGEGVPPADQCAKGTFGTTDTLRRVLRAQVRVANLG